MTTYIVLIRVATDAAHSPQALVDLEKQVVAQLRDQCPDVRWLHSYAVLGPGDHLDIFTAPDVETATKLSTIMRTCGCASAEIWPATEWGKFKTMIHNMPHAA